MYLCLVPVLSTSAGCEDAKRRRPDAVGQS